MFGAMYDPGDKSDGHVEQRIRELARKEQADDVLRRFTRDMNQRSWLSPEQATELQGQVAAMQTTIQRVLERHQMLRTQMAPGPNTEICTCPLCEMLRTALSSPAAATEVLRTAVEWATLMDVSEPDETKRGVLSTHILHAEQRVRSAVTAYQKEQGHV